MTVSLLIAMAAALVAAVATGALSPVFSLAAVGLLAAAVYWLLRERVHDILLMFASVFLLLMLISTPAVRLVDPSGVKRLEQSWAEGTFDERLPAVLHLVFDEMMSPGAMDDSVPGAAPARAALYELGARHGLRTFDSIYSRAFFSGLSLPNLFNAEFRGDTGMSARFPTLLLATPQNAYFDALANRGYRTIVFQTSLLDFCGNRNVDGCEVFRSYDPAALRSGSLDFRSRIVHVLTVLLRAFEPSYVSFYGRRRLSGQDPQEAAAAQKLGAEERFDVQGFPAWFDRFVAFVERVPRGTHVFAHFMVPHAPYLLQPDCTIGGRGDAGYYLAERFADPAAREAARRAYYAAYLAQLRCVTSRIDEFFGAVQRNPALHDARIVIHGDHGSRISAGNRIEDYERQDFISNYGTYFAVRAPGTAAGTDCRFLSLAEAFRAHITPQAPPPIDRPAPPVVVRSRSGENVFVEAEMPPFGCAAQTAAGQ